MVPKDKNLFHDLFLRAGGVIGSTTDNILENGRLQGARTLTHGCSSRQSTFSASQHQAAHFADRNNMYVPAKGQSQVVSLESRPLDDDLYSPCKSGPVLEKRPDRVHIAVNPGQN